MEWTWLTITSRAVHWSHLHFLILARWKIKHTSKAKKTAEPMKWGTRVGGGASHGSDDAMRRAHPSHPAHPGLGLTRPSPAAAMGDSVLTHVSPLTHPKPYHSTITLHCVWHIRYLINVVKKYRKITLLTASWFRSTLRCIHYNDNTYVTYFRKY